MGKKYDSKKMYNYLLKNRSNNVTEKEFNKNKEDHLTQSQLLLAKSSELVAGLPLHP